MPPKSRNQEQLTTKKSSAIAAATITSSKATIPQSKKAAISTQGTSSTRRKTPKNTRATRSAPEDIHKVPKPYKDQENANKENESSQIVRKRATASSSQEKQKTIKEDLRSDEGHEKIPSSTPSSISAVKSLPTTKKKLLEHQKTMRSDLRSDDEKRKEISTLSLTSTSDTKSVAKLKKQPITVKKKTIEKQKTIKLKKDLGSDDEEETSNHSTISTSTSKKPLRKVKTISQEKETDTDTESMKKTTPAITRTKSTTLYQHYIDNVFENPDSDRQKECKKLARDTINRLMEHIVSKQNSGIMSFLFSKTVVAAGSVSTKTSVQNIHDFDFNVSLMVVKAETTTEGEINEICTKSRHLSEKARISRSEIPQPIPEGHAIVYGQGGIIYPRKVRETLYHQLIDAVKELKMKDVEIDNEVRGPAVGIIIKDKISGEEIDIDLSPSIEVTDIRPRDWPNPNAQAFKSEKGKEIVRTVNKTKMHLVPKMDLFWRISYSKKIKILINNMDTHGECRKRCHKILKHDFQTWKDKYSDRYPGISTYIFSHHLLWMNEKYCESKYWSGTNIDTCYMEMLKDLAGRLKQRKLLHYFNTIENLLEKKPKLDGLAQAMMDRRKEIQKLRDERQFQCL